MKRSQVFFRYLTLAAALGLAGYFLFHRAIVPTDKSRASGWTRHEIAAIRTALNHYEARTARLPSTADGLKVLVQTPGQVPRDLWREGELEYLPRDAWGREFHYACPPVGRAGRGKKYEITSAGLDGRFGTRDDIQVFGKFDGGGAVNDPLQGNELGLDWLLGMIIIASGVLAIHGLRVDQRQEASRRWRTQV